MTQRNAKSDGFFNLHLFGRPGGRRSRSRILARCLALAALAFLTFGFDIGGCTTTAPPPRVFDTRFYGLGTNGDAFYGPLTVYATAVDPRTGDVFVGGSFDTIGDVEAHNVAFYRRVENRWYSLRGKGLDGAFPTEVRALEIVGDRLFVGGAFTRTFDASTPNLNNIARYDIGDGSPSAVEAGTWSPLQGNGLGGKVTALKSSGVFLYAGGAFTANFNGSTTLNRIAEYDTLNNTWAALPGNGLNDDVNALELFSEVFAHRLYVGGRFTQTMGGTPVTLNRIAAFDLDSRSWQPLAENGLNGEVNALVYKFANNSYVLYIGGSFTGTVAFPGLEKNNIAKYNAVSDNWPTTLDEQFPDAGLDGPVYALDLITTAGGTTRLLAGGAFSRTSHCLCANTLNRAGVFDFTANAWTAFPGNGLDDEVYSIKADTGDVFVGGKFRKSFNAAQSLNGIARLQSLPAGSGISFAKNRAAAFDDFKPLGATGGQALNRDVQAVAVDAAGNIYAGGNFSQTLDGAVTNLNRIARYDPVTRTWSALAAGGLDNTVTSLAVIGDDLYVGGVFTQTFDGSVTLNRVARYNLTTNSWSPLSHNGLNSVVSALAVKDNDLYVGGFFARTFDSAVTNLNRIARYDVTTGTWSPLANNGLNSTVETLAVTGDDLYAGGSFSRTADNSTDLFFIARYDLLSGTWLPLADEGLNNAVKKLAISDGRVVVHGNFLRTHDNFIDLNRIAAYDPAGETWTEIGGTTEDRSNVLAAAAAVQSGSELYVGGNFRAAGGRVALFFTRIYLEKWRTPSPTTDWFDGANWTTGAPPAVNGNAVIPDGAGQIDIASADVVLNDLNLNGGTVTVGPGRTLTINGILSLNGGVIDGGGTVVIANCAPEGISGGGPTAYVRAALNRCVSGGRTYNFEVGTANGYSPVTIKGVSGAGNVSVKANPGAYSGPASGLPATRLAGWWRIDNPGGGVTGADIYFNYRPADAPGDENAYKAFRIAGGAATMLAGTANAFANRVSAVGVTGFSDWTLAPLAPTAARVSVGGRVTLNGRRAIAGAGLTLTAPDGATRAVRTNSFGYYRFDDLAAGETYVIAIGHKRYFFKPASRFVTAADNVTDADFEAGAEN
ncbi:MAG: carboxypeptidase regulatory-like domain-containing protein [Acidobacteria bacterium]|nr:carboxypeptidase regulatory-like domain-containing protein [Acidobacteriota bacterium]